MTYCSQCGLLQVSHHYNRLRVTVNFYSEILTFVLLLACLKS